MDRITQLMIERKLSEGLAALPKSTKLVINAWYNNAIREIETGKTENKLNDDDLRLTMEAVNYAVKGFRQSGGA